MTKQVSLYWQRILFHISIWLFTAITCHILFTHELFKIFIFADISYLAITKLFELK